jgi:hypothetical protein
MLQGREIMSKTISCSVSDEVYQIMQEKFEASSFGFFSDYLKALIGTDLIEMEHFQIKLSVKDRPMVSHLFTTCIMIDLVKKMAQEKSEIQSLKKDKKLMYKFISKFFAITNVRTSGLLNVFENEIERNFGNEMKYQTNMMMQLVGDIIGKFYNRPALIAQTNEFVTSLAKKRGIK